MAALACSLTLVGVTPIAKSFAAEASADRSRKWRRHSVKLATPPIHFWPHLVSQTWRPSGLRGRSLQTPAFAVSVTAHDSSKVDKKESSKQKKNEMKEAKKAAKKMDSDSSCSSSESSSSSSDSESDMEDKKRMKKKEKNEKRTVGGSALKFSKYQGLGNDFLMVDARSARQPKVSPAQAVKILDRNFGVGADGIIFALPGSNGADYSMRILNSDGSEPEMCGNGIRCLAKFLAEMEDITEGSFRVDTLAGPIIPRIRKDGLVEVDMGKPILNAPDVPTSLKGRDTDGAVVGQPLEVDGVTWSVTAVSMGNPHCVTFLDKDVHVESVALSDIGPKFEHHPAFPARTNTEFIQILSPSHVRMRVWERGAGATLACGTGACAVVVAGVLEGRLERSCTVDLPGGPLEIEWREDNEHVYMTGPAEHVFSGTVVV